MKWDFSPTTQTTLPEALINALSCDLASGIEDIGTLRPMNNNEKKCAESLLPYHRKEMNYNFSKYLSPSLFFFPKDNIHAFDQHSFQWTIFYIFYFRKNSHPYLFHSPLSLTLILNWGRGKCFFKKNLIYNWVTVIKVLLIPSRSPPKTWSIWVHKSSTCQKDLSTPNKNIKLIWR